MVRLRLKVPAIGSRPAHSILLNTSISQPTRSCRWNSTLYVLVAGSYKYWCKKREFGFDDGGSQIRPHYSTSPDPSTISRRFPHTPHLSRLPFWHSHSARRVSWGPPRGWCLEGWVLGATHRRRSNPPSINRFPVSTTEKLAIMGCSSIPTLAKTEGTGTYWALFPMGNILILALANGLNLSLTSPWTWFANLVFRPLSFVVYLEVSTTAASAYYTLSRSTYPHIISSVPSHFSPPKRVYICTGCDRKRRAESVTSAKAPMEKVR